MWRGIPALLGKKVTHGHRAGCAKNFQVPTQGVASLVKAYWTMYKNATYKLYKTTTHKSTGLKNILVSQIVVLIFDHKLNLDPG